METILGNQEQRENLKKIIQSGNIGHAYLFVGQDGIGKFEIAKEFAKSILCLHPTDRYCNCCECCEIFENSPDFITITDQDDSIKVGDIRTLSENILLKPVKSERRVFIIRQADKMNEAAQNALLKILEEPPEYATIILVLSNKEKILKTILSRCVQIQFKPLTIEEMHQYYQGQEIQEELFDYARGSIGMLEKLKSSGYMQHVIALEKAINYQDLLEMNRALTSLKENKIVKENMNDILDLLLVKLRLEISQDYARKVSQIEIIEECRRNLKRNANFDITLDCMMVKLWELEKRE